MKNNYIYVCILALLSSCNNLSQDFFEFLFNSEDISLDRECSQSPSIFSEGRSFEIYSMSEINADIVVQNILKKSKVTRNDKYARFEIPHWHKTPINQGDTVYAFIHSEMRDEKNKCFDENALVKILQEEKNYYTFLYDDLGRIKLFIWDTKNYKLFLLTSYEL